MDSEIIYVKTAFGDEVMHQRTRVMQRNVRMVLILVDGRSTVSDLCLKTGNVELTENALQELEKGGFIEPAAERDSIWAESKRVAQEIRSAAFDKAQQLAPSRPRKSSLSSETANASSTTSERDEIISSPPASASAISQPPSRHFQSSELPEMKAMLPGQAGRRDDSPKASGERTKVAGGASPHQVGESRKDDVRKAEKAAAITPIRRGRRKSLTWPVLLLLAVIGVPALAYLGVVLFPYQRYLPELQATLSQLCGRPVTVGGMRVDVYPKPGLFLRDVAIGSGHDTLRAARIRLQPEVTSLLASRKQFQEVSLRGVTLSPDSIIALQAVLAAVAKPGAPAGIGHVSLEETEVLFGGLGLREMEGEARLAQDGSFQSVSLHSIDRSLTLSATPQTEGVDVVVDGFGWRSSKESPWYLDSISLKGRVDKDTLMLNTVDIRLFDGSIHGKIVLRKDSKPSMAGDLVFERINSTALGEALGIGRQLSGDIAGSVGFSATAKAWASILSAIEADGQFSMQRGSIQGFDLAEVVRRVSSNPVQGGVTQFEQLSGKIRASPTGFRFSSLNLVSGLMQSTGQVEVSKALRISGAMELRMRGTVNQTRVPISIDGLLRSPELQRGKGD